MAFSNCNGSMILSSEHSRSPKSLFIKIERKYMEVGPEQSPVTCFNLDVLK